MRILVSAYACEPDKGSEPGVGWNWVLELSGKHEVWVLTKENNKKTIEDYLNEHGEIDASNIHFVYVNVSKKLTFWKKGNRGIRLYYWIWQKKALIVAKKLCKKIEFDYVHCLTFVSYTQPSFLYKLGIPIVWNVAGGENIPKSIKLKMSTKDWISTIAREWYQKIVLYFHWNKQMMDLSELIIATTEETKRALPKLVQEKVIIMPSIGIEDEIFRFTQRKIDYPTKSNGLRVLMAGRFIYWKAIDLGLKGFKKYQEKFPDASLDILGHGEKKEYLERIIKNENIQNVHFVKEVSHDDVYKFYRMEDVFLNTSMRDSGCMVLLEARSVGLPVIFVDTGGPSVLFKDVFCKKIFPKNNEYVINEVAKALCWYTENLGMLKRDGINGRNIIEQSHLYSRRIDSFSQIWMMNKEE